MKIGNIQIKYPYFPAPMAGHTDFPFRKLLDEIGYIGATFSEMISVEGLNRGNQQTLKMLEQFQSKYPQFVQLFGSSEIAFQDAIKYIQNNTKFDGININMGCPVKKVIKKGAGCYLLKNTNKVKSIIKSIKKFALIPITIKIRLGFKKVNVQKIVEISENAGVDAIIIHFRTCNQNYSTPTQWELVNKIIDFTNIPIIGNGDINSPNQAHNKIKKINGIMIGREILKNPSIFRQIAGKSKFNDRIIINRFIELMKDYYPKQKWAPRIKSFISYFTKGKKNGKYIREIIFRSHDYSKIEKILFKYY